MLLSLVSAAVQGGVLPSWFVPQADGSYAARSRGWPVHLGANAIQIGPLTLEIAGADPGASPVTTGEITRIHRLLGTPSGWETNIRAASSVVYPEVLPSINLRFGFRGADLKSEYLVRPGGDPYRIRFRYVGALDTRIKDGTLVIQTAEGELREPPPLVYQENGSGARTPVSAEYRLARDGYVSFELGPYRRDLPLVIDPFLVTAAALSGGSRADFVGGMTADAAGNIYVAGWTESTDFPAGRTGGSVDAFVLKLNPQATQVLFATFFGGSDYDAAKAVAVDAGGNIWLAGVTQSTDLVRVNAIQQTIGGDNDAFVARLNANGSALLFSTYLGGDGSDSALGLAVSTTGDVWVAGGTASSNFPLNNAYQAARRGPQDAFLARFSLAGAMVSSTLYGGSGADAAHAVAVGPDGTAYMTGATDSADLPLVASTRPRGGSQDAFAVRWNTQASAPIYSTYLGGSAGSYGVNEYGTAVAVDSAGAAAIAGITSSTDFPLARNTFGSGATDAFVARLSPAGSLTASAYFGGTSTDEAYGVAFDAQGRVWVCGASASSDTPSTGAIQTPRPGNYDAFAVRLSNDLATITFASHFGGTQEEKGVAILPSGSRVLLAGETQSTDMPYMMGYRGLQDIWVLQLGEQVEVSLTSSPSGLPVSVTGQGCPVGTWTTPAVLNWSAGVSCTVSADAVRVPAMGTRQVFRAWENGGTAGARTVAPTGAVTLHASYDVFYALTTSVTPAASGSVQATPASADGYWPAGSSVQLLAVPASGKRWTGWTGTVVLTSNPATVLMSGAQSVQATFAAALPPCAYAVSPSSISFPAAGGSAGLTVTAASHCSWTAVSNSSWLSLANASGTGTATVAITAGSNSGPLRTGAIQVNGAQANITQSGSEPMAYPGFVSVFPFAGSGVTQTFTATYSDANGWSDIASAFLAFNVTPIPNGACYIEVSPVQNELTLYHENGTSKLGPAKFGSPSVLENSACAVNLALSSFSGVGSSLTFSVSITFKTPFIGVKKNMWLGVDDRTGRSSGWFLVGAYWPGNVTGVPVNRYRIYNPGSGSHIHTTDYNEYVTLGTWGFILEGVTGKIYSAPATVSGVELTPMYRVFNQTGGRHFWTADRNEYLTLIRFVGINIGEGIDGFIVPSPGVQGTIPLYRLVQTYSNPAIHHWTQLDNEYNYLPTTGVWKKEGVAAWIFP